MQYSKRASKSIASITQTYSKQPCRFVEGIYPHYVDRGFGCYVWQGDKKYTDYICGLGTNILGYANPIVNEAVIEQIKEGVLFSFPHPKEVELAELIKSVIPSMELVRFLKSGSEAVSAGIKIARAFTKRDLVLSNAYHGWHDWSTPITENNLGTPKSFKSTIRPFEYDNLSSLEEALMGNDVACVVLEPYVFTEPSQNYLRDMIALSHKYGALVLFDEVITGFRWENFCVQNNYSAMPDLTALGKSMANGFPMSCIGGRADVMSVLDNGCFVSSTFGGDLVGISASLATIKEVVSQNVPEELYLSGKMLQDGLNKIGVKCIGHPSRQKIVLSDEHKALFWQECALRGVLFGGAQHTSLAHTLYFIKETLVVANEAMKIVTNHFDFPGRAMKGEMPKLVSTIVNLR